MTVERRDADQKLMRIGQLSFAFASASAVYVRDNDKLQKKIDSCFTADDREKSSEYLSIINEFEPDVKSEEFQMALVNMADLNAGILLRVIPKEEAGKYIHPELKSPENVEILKKLGAKNLISLI